MKELLVVDTVKYGYGKKKVLRGISFSVRQGTIVAMIGPRGSGKSTVLKTIVGLVDIWDGTIKFDGKYCLAGNTTPIVDQGLEYMSQEMRIFNQLSVRDNLLVSLRGLDSSEIASRLREMENFFPVLGERATEPASELSAGERKQVFLGMKLIKHPKMLLLDEPSIALTPKLVTKVFNQLKELKDHFGVTILVVEHKVRAIFKVADKAIGLKRGRIMYSGEPSSFTDRKLKRLFRI
jgi:branched-chain amino acid transport system ATP-binding protein